MIKSPGTSLVKLSKPHLETLNFRTLKLFVGGSSKILVYSNSLKSTRTNDDIEKYLIWSRTQEREWNWNDTFGPEFYPIGSPSWYRDDKWQTHRHPCDNFETFKVKGLNISTLISLVGQTNGPWIDQNREFRYVGLLGGGLLGSGEVRVYQPFGLLLSWLKYPKNTTNFLCYTNFSYSLTNHVLFPGFLPMTINEEGV